MKKLLIAVGIYALGFLITVGYSWNHLAPTYYDSWVERERIRGNDDRVIATFGCSVFWPLYWSVQLQKGTR